MKKINLNPGGNKGKSSKDEKPEIYAVKKDSNGIKVERRDFLIRLGLLTGAAVAGCNDINNKIIPGVLGDSKTIPQNIKADICDNLNAHSASVNSVSFSPDGMFLASAGSDSTVKLWSVSDGELLITFRDHTNGVNSICFSPDSKMLASGSSDNTVKLWSVSDKEMLKNLEGHTGSVNCVSFTPDGKSLVSASSDNSIKLWSIPGGQLLKSLEGHSNSVIALSVSQDGTRLASGSEDNSLKIWSLPDGQLLKSTEGNLFPVGSLIFSPDGKILASCSENNIKLWSLPDGQLFTTLKGHTQIVNSVCFSPDGKKLVSGSNDMTIRLWSVTDSQLVITSKGHTNSVRSVCFSPDGNKLASCGDDQTIKIWDLTSYPKVEPDGIFRDGLPDHSSPFAESEKKIVFNTSEGFIKVLDINSNSITYTIIPRVYVSEFAISANDEYLVAGTYDGHIKWWKLADRKKKKFRVNKVGISRILIKKDNKEFITCGSDGLIKIWSLPENVLVRTLTQTENSIRSLALSPDQKYLASQSANSVYIWSLESFSIIKTISENSAPLTDAGNAVNADSLSVKTDSKGKTFTGIINCMQFAPQSTKLILGTTLGYYVYDYSKDTFIANNETANPIISFSVTSDEKYIALAYQTMGIEIRSLLNNALLKIIEIPGHIIQKLAFINEDNKLIVYTDSFIRVYQITDFIDDMILTSCLYDKNQLAQEIKGIQYKLGSKSMTLPCGSPIPEGAVCTCNCVTIGSPITYSNTYYYTYWYPN
jgi:WD40 repeat protein